MLEHFEPTTIYLIVFMLSTVTGFLFSLSSNKFGTGMIFGFIGTALLYFVVEFVVGLFPQDVFPSYAQFNEDMVVNLNVIGVAFLGGIISELLANIKRRFASSDNTKTMLK